MTYTALKFIDDAIRILTLSPTDNLPMSELSRFTASLFHHSSISVIIMVMYDNDIAHFLLSAYDLGMINGEYVFIALDAAEGNINRSFCL